MLSNRTIPPRVLRWSIVVFAMTCLLAPVMPGLAQDDDSGPEIPDLSKMEAPELRILAESLYYRMYLLEKKVKQLETSLEDVTDRLKNNAAGLDEEIVDQWTVRITGFEEVDVEQLREQIKQIDARLNTELRSISYPRESWYYDTTRQVSGLTGLINHAQTQLTRMNGEKVSYYENGRSKTRAKYSSSDLAQMRLHIKKLEREKLSLQREAKQLQDEIDRAATSRRATGLTSDGRPMLLFGRGAFANQIAELQVGQNYRITGDSTQAGGTLRVNMTAYEIAPEEADDPAQ